ncbi:DNA-binding protein [Neiella marina]|uniref:DNA-binding protein n=1 Tax=Neiella marina TaxID=508461 RepID=A0A8J2XMS8_9GAMM|nr:DNA-binding protein [Neiella marina]GGA67178.1 DNA-binding protein [Neiella marina]
MTYEEFQRQLGKAGVTMRMFAELVKMNHVSLSNYSKKGTVPTHIAIIAALMGEMAEHGLDYRNVLENLDISRKRPRGAARKGKFGGDKQSDLDLPL